MMFVSEVSSRLGPGLGGGGVVSEGKIGSAVNGESSGYVSAVKSFAPSIGRRGHARKSLGMPERVLFIGKLLVFFSLLANAGFLVTALSNPKGDITVAVHVPSEAELGSTVNMNCNWSITGDKKLYSVKWYKDDHEFFRYMPDSQETMQTFQQTGVKLNIKACTKNKIRLIELTVNSSGQYKCEVSTDGPSFATEYKTGNLTILTLPAHGPKITGLATFYAVGENVTANCTAWPSIPRAILKWTINDKPVPEEYTYAPAKSSGAPNSLGLRLEAETRHFAGGEGTVKIRCLSSVGSKRYMAEKTVHMAHVNNLRLSAGDSRGGATGKIRGSPQQNILAVILGLVGLYGAT